MEIDLAKAFKQWHYQKMNAGRRQIPFKLSFNEWLNIWITSGKYHLRGRGTGKYVMSRYGDQGAYEVGNVYINTDDENKREAGLRGNSGQFKKGRKMSAKQTENVSKATKARWEQYRIDNPKPPKPIPKSKILVCPHCGKQGAARGLKVWHFDKCKMKQ